MISRNIVIAGCFERRQKMKLPTPFRRTPLLFPFSPSIGALRVHLPDNVEHGSGFGHVLQDKRFLACLVFPLRLNAVG